MNLSFTHPLTLQEATKEEPKTETEPKKEEEETAAPETEATTEEAATTEEGGATTEGNDEAQADPDDTKGRRVYIGNLSWGVSWQDLKDHMREAGEVTRADIMTGADGRSKGCGIVEYENDEDAKKAVLTLNDTELNGRQIFVREDREDKGSSARGNRFSSDDQAQSRRVYVGNLSWDVAWQDLKDHMVSCVVLCCVMCVCGNEEYCLVLQTLLLTNILLSVALLLLLLLTTARSW